MNDIFDEATKDAEKLLEEETTASETEETVENTTELTEETENAQPDKDAMLDEATKTAEMAAELASNKDAELQQTKQALEAEKQKNAELQGTVDELSEKNKENLIDKILEPPTLDINALAFADSDTQEAEMQKYAKAMSEYDRQEILKELAPELNYARQSMKEAEKAEAIKVISEIPELKAVGIEKMAPMLDKFISENKWLSTADNMTMTEKYINALTMVQGINALNAVTEEPKKLTPEEMLKLYNDDPAFQELVEKQRIEQIKPSQQVPPFSASSGAVNAALNIPEAPKSWDDASNRSTELFDKLFRKK